MSLLTRLNQDFIFSMATFKATLEVTPLPSSLVCSRVDNQSRKRPPLPFYIGIPAQISPYRRTNREMFLLLPCLESPLFNASLDLCRRNRRSVGLLCTSLFSHQLLFCCGSRLNGLGLYLTAFVHLNSLIIPSTYVASKAILSGKTMV